MVLEPQVPLPPVNVQPGQRVRVRHRVRIGSSAAWEVETEGVVEAIEEMPTSLHTDRIHEDDLWVRTLLLRKDDGELTRVTIDQFSTIVPVSEPGA